MLTHCEGVLLEAFERPRGVTASYSRPDAAEEFELLDVGQRKDFEDARLKYLADLATRLKRVSP